ncbi:hypothetical protein [Marinobacterium arenosum]|uniref:hypothetical protein n=1 Tax=Marinobacterium arenosum TaxID=2862496 RepID=UPI001C95EA7A|nr:hypothetical protein [Marinobacterium arenosum]MBY4676573.1 hypothetical protein [Marinobacterium arenosum]
MNKLTQVVLATAFSTLLLSPAYGASAKFAAHAKDMSNLQLISTTEQNAGFANAPVYTTLMSAGIRTANKKDLLIGVSLELGLHTETNVKGKNGTAEKAGAKGGVAIRVLVDGVEAAPGQVIFTERYQELSAVMGGVIESCDVSVDPLTGDGTITIADDCEVTAEEIGLILETTAAHHFNFIMPNMEPGDHFIEVKADLYSSTELSGEYDIDGDNSAKAWATVGVGSLTVQEVQAVNIKDSDGSGTDLQL